MCVQDFSSGSCALIANEHPEAGSSSNQVIARISGQAHGVNQDCVQGISEQQDFSSGGGSFIAVEHTDTGRPHRLSHAGSCLWSCQEAGSK